MKVFDADNTRMIGLPYGEKNYDNMLSRFHPIPERYGRTDRQKIPISISRVSMLTRDKNRDFQPISGFGIDQCGTIACRQRFDGVV